jgi:hypothetical protein
MQIGCGAGFLRKFDLKRHYGSKRGQQCLNAIQREHRLATLSQRLADKDAAYALMAIADSAANETDPEEDGVLASADGFLLASSDMTTDVETISEATHDQSQIKDPEPSRDRVIVPDLPSFPEPTRLGRFTDEPAPRISPQSSSLPKPIMSSPKSKRTTKASFGNSRGSRMSWTKTPIGSQLHEYAKAFRP